LFIVCQALVSVDNNQVTSITSSISFILIRFSIPLRLENNRFNHSNVLFHNNNEPETSAVTGEYFNIEYIDFIHHIHLPRSHVNKASHSISLLNLLAIDSDIHFHLPYDIRYSARLDGVTHGSFIKAYLKEPHMLL